MVGKVKFIPFCISPELPQDEEIKVVLAQAKYGCSELAKRGLFPGYSNGIGSSGNISGVSNGTNPNGRKYLTTASDIPTKLSPPEKYFTLVERWNPDFPDTKLIHYSGGYDPDSPAPRKIRSPTSEFIGGHLGIYQTMPWVLGIVHGHIEKQKMYAVRDRWKRAGVVETAVSLADVGGTADMAPPIIEALQRGEWVIARGHEYEGAIGFWVVGESMDDATLTTAQIYDFLYAR